MAIIKKADIKKMSVSELKEKIEQLKNELNREMSSKKVPGKTFNYGKCKELKRTIARLLTHLKILEKSN